MSAASNGPDRIDRALVRDLSNGLRRWPAWLFLGAFGLGAAIQILRGGPERLPLVLTIAGGCLAYGLLAWQAGRSPAAWYHPSVVRAPRAEMVAVIVAYAGVAGYLMGLGFGPLFVVGVGAWVFVAIRARYRPSDLAWATRGWRPLLPLLVAVLVPKLLLAGPAALVGLPLALGGVVQQVLLQVGLTARLEALAGRSDMAAVLAALAFGVAHAGLNLPQAHGDHLLALSAALVLQAPIGLVFCIAYLRHRAPLALGVSHAIAIA